MCDDAQLQSWLEKLCAPESELTPLARHKILSRLMLCIARSPRLWRDSHQDYAMALNRTLVWVRKDICKFDPGDGSVSEALLRWVNGTLKRRVQDLRGARGLGAEDDRTDRDYRRIAKLGLGPPVELDKPVIDSQGHTTTQAPLTADPKSGRYTLLEQWIERLQAQQYQRIGQQVRAYLESDPHGVLRACQSRKYPDCHCQGLVQGLYLSQPPLTQRAIATQLKANEQTVYTHWRDKCLPLLQIIALRHDPQVRNYLQVHSDRDFGQGQLEGTEHGSCLELSQRLLLSEVLSPLRAIAKELRVNETDLVAHWQTQCLPHLKRHRL
ncbi:hypothetical protein IQ273_05595 [Nodosilinea sp. LEGE 07298]|nr:hypothetical protein [Nodosilinea sp. LEGE 07298]